MSLDGTARGPMDMQGRDLAGGGFEVRAKSIGDLVDDSKLLELLWCRSRAGPGARR
jgi:hypothetical protein